jgi:hypothetical protein
MVRVDRTGTIGTIHSATRLPRLEVLLTVLAEGTFGSARVTTVGERGAEKSRRMMAHASALEQEPSA